MPKNPNKVAGLSVLALFWVFIILFIVLSNRVLPELVYKIVWTSGASFYQHCVSQGMVGRAENMRGFITSKCEDTLVEPWMLIFVVARLPIILLLLISGIMLTLRIAKMYEKKHNK
jgi:hypothetical protein